MFLSTQLYSAPSIALLNDMKVIRRGGLCLQKSTIMPIESHSSPFPYLYLLALFKNWWTNWLSNHCSWLVCLDWGWQLKWFSFCYRTKTFPFFLFLPGDNRPCHKLLHLLTKKIIIKKSLPSPLAQIQTNIYRSYMSWRALLLGLTISYRQ